MQQLIDRRRLAAFTLAAALVGTACTTDREASEPSHIDAPPEAATGAGPTKRGPAQPSSDPLERESGEMAALATEMFPEIIINESLVDDPSLDGFGLSDDGEPAVFERDVLVFVEDDPGEIADFAERHGGVVLDDDADLTTRVRFDPGDRLAADLDSDVEGLRRRLGGMLDLDRMADVDEGPVASSEDAVRLLDLATRASSEGLGVTLNFELDSAINPTVLAGESTEAWAWNGSADPFKWDYMIDGSVQDHGVTEAWRLFDAVGKLEPSSVKIAVLDQGFTVAGTADLAGSTLYPATADGRQADNCDGTFGACQHGTGVAIVAAGDLDNGSGSAGPAGPVADLVLVDNRGDGGERIFLTGTLDAMREASRAQPDIMNISFGGVVPWYLAWAIDPFHAVVADYFTDRGTLVVVSADNDGEDVDAEASCGFLGSCGFERKLHYPCETATVLCVGGLAQNSTDRHPLSNFGDEDVDIWAPFVHAGPGGPLTGTSFSSPFVAGIAALLKGARPTASPDVVRRQLLSTARTVDGRRIVDAAEMARLNTAGFRADDGIDELDVIVERSSPQSFRLAARFNGLTQDRLRFGSVQVDDAYLATFDRIEWTINGIREGHGANWAVNTPQPGAYLVEVAYTKFDGSVLRGSMLLDQPKVQPTIEWIERLPDEVTIGKTLTARARADDHWDTDLGLRWSVDGVEVSTAPPEQRNSQTFGSLTVNSRDLGVGVHVIEVQTGTWRGQFASTRHEFRIVEPAVIDENNTVPTLQILDIVSEVVAPNVFTNFRFELLATDEEDGDLTNAVAIEIRCDDGERRQLDLTYMDGMPMLGLYQRGVDDCRTSFREGWGGYPVVATVTDSDGNTVSDESFIPLRVWVR